MTTGSAPSGGVVEARAAAEGALDRAGIDVREVHEFAELRVVKELLDSLWQVGPANPVVTAELLRAYEHTGQYVVLATDRTRPGSPAVAASVAFLSAPAGRAMHSHVTGVPLEHRGRALGFALKLHQRAWALERGLTEITWTFDPLIRRNAWFNLAKLGGGVDRYLVDFYGSMEDAVNAGDASDRLYLRWRLDSPPVLRAAAGRPAEPDVAALRSAGAVEVLAVDGRGGPARPDGGGPGGRVWLAQVPPDTESLRRADPELARAWRGALRDVLGGALAEGRRVSGFSREGWYVIEPGEGEREGVL